MKPATEADSTETKNNEIAVIDVFPKQTLYLASHATMSNTMLAAVKPKKKTPPGLNMKLMAVAIIPTIVAAPSFLIHQTVTERTAKPIMSQRIGNPNMLNTIGEKIEFNTPQRAESKATAAISRLL